MARKKNEDGGYGRALALLVALAVVAVVAAVVSMGGEEAPAPPARSSAPAPVATRPGAVAAADHHPAPRATAAEITLQPPARYARWPRLAATYRKAAEIPEVLDGIHCYCDCSEHSGHYSLLSCYEDDHAAQCDVCLSQAEMAWDMSGKGKSLETIRLATDATYGD
ncbi:MAG: CYCXC family (seleno)protein [Gemmatimonadota bacterium]|nr:CYCXC family (seleno)protein [Gemmatimonadota bacterium]